MNRSSLNGSVLGSGSHSSRVVVAIQEVLQLAGALRTSVIKYCAVRTTLTVQSTLLAHRRVEASVSTVLTLSGVYHARVLRRVYGGALEFARLATSLKSYVLVTSKAVGSTALSGALTPSTRHLAHTSLRGWLRLDGVLLGSDYYLGHAPLDRTTSVPGDARFVAVPGTDHSTEV